MASTPDFVFHHVYGELHSDQLNEHGDNAFQREVRHKIRDSAVPLLKRDSERMAVLVVLGEQTEEDAEGNFWPLKLKEWCRGARYEKHFIDPLTDAEQEEDDNTYQTNPRRFQKPFLISNRGLNVVGIKLDSVHVVGFPSPDLNGSMAVGMRFLDEVWQSTEQALAGSLDDVINIHLYMTHSDPDSIALVSNWCASYDIPVPAWFADENAGDEEEYEEEEGDEEYYEDEEEGDGNEYYEEEDDAGFEQQTQLDDYFDFSTVENPCPGLELCQGLLTAAEIELTQGSYEEIKSSGSGAYDVKPLLCTSTRYQKIKETVEGIMSPAIFPLLFESANIADGQAPEVPKGGAKGKGAKGAATSGAKPAEAKPKVNNRSIKSRLGIKPGNIDEKDLRHVIGKAPTLDNPSGGGGGGGIKSRLGGAKRVGPTKKKVFDATPAPRQASDVFRPPTGGGFDDDFDAPVGGGRGGGMGGPGQMMGGRGGAADFYDPFDRPVMQQQQNRGAGMAMGDQFGDARGRPMFRDGQGSAMDRVRDRSPIRMGMGGGGMGYGGRGPSPPRIGPMGGRSGPFGERGPPHSQGMMGPGVGPPSPPRMGQYGNRGPSPQGVYGGNDGPIMRGGGGGPRGFDSLMNFDTSFGGGGRNSEPGQMMGPYGQDRRNAGPGMMGPYGDERRSAGPGPMGGPGMMGPYRDERRNAGPGPMGGHGQMGPYGEGRRNAGSGPMGQNRRNAGPGQMGPFGQDLNVYNVQVPDLPMPPMPPQFHDEERGGERMTDPFAKRGGGGGRDRSPPGRDRRSYSPRRRRSPTPPPPSKITDSVIQRWENRARSPPRRRQRSPPQAPAPPKMAARDIPQLVPPAPPAWPMPVRSQQQKPQQPDGPAFQPFNKRVPDKGISIVLQKDKEGKKRNRVRPKKKNPKAQNGEKITIGGATLDTSNVKINPKVSEALNSINGGGQQQQQQQETWFSGEKRGDPVLTEPLSFGHKEPSPPRVLPVPAGGATGGFASSFSMSGQEKPRTPEPAKNAGGKASDADFKLSLAAHLCMLQTKRGKSAEIGGDMMLTWRMAGHNEATLRELCQKTEAAHPNQLRMHFMRELFDVKDVPDTVNVSQIVDDTVEFYMPEDAELRAKRLRGEMPARVSTTKKQQPSVEDQTMDFIRELGEKANQGGISAGKNTDDLKHSYVERIASLYNFQSFLLERLRSIPEMNAVADDRKVKAVEDMLRSLAEAGIHQASLSKVFADFGEASVKELLVNKLAFREAEGRKFPFGINSKLIGSWACEFMKQKQ